ncbi:hypothetical protein ACJROX_05775 [Pseudalkalibacillus sp. A8]
MKPNPPNIPTSEEKYPKLNPAKISTPFIPNDWNESIVALMLELIR